MKYQQVKLELEPVCNQSPQKVVNSQRADRVADVAANFKLKSTGLNQDLKGFSTPELLTIILGADRKSSGPRILQELSQNGQELLEVLRGISRQELMRIPGVGAAKAQMILAAIELGKRVFYPRLSEGTIIDSPEKAASALSYDLMSQLQERFAVLLLDVKYRLLGTQVITTGTETETLAPPRNIFGLALRLRVTRIIVAHNHPSGCVEASPEDINLTRKLLQGAQLLNIALLDHLILGTGNFQSLRQTTNLWSEYPQGD